MIFHIVTAQSSSNESTSPIYELDVTGFVPRLESGVLAKFSSGHSFFKDRDQTVINASSTVMNTLDREKLLKLSICAELTCRPLKCLPEIDIDGPSGELSLALLIYNAFELALSGLSYQEEKEQTTLIFATGTVLANGEVGAVGQISAKLTSVIEYLKNHEEKQAIFIYPRSTEFDFASVPTIPSNLKVESFSFFYEVIHFLKLGTAKPISLFLGLESYNFEDKDRFVGREELIEEAISKLRLNTSGSGSLLLTGYNGAGKSSLAKAGVLPALVSNPALLSTPGRPCDSIVYPKDGGSENPIGTLTVNVSYDNFLNSLFKFLRSELNLGLELSCEQVRVQPLSLVQDIQAYLSNNKSTSLLIVLDQLEDVFSWSSNERGKKNVHYETLLFFDLLSEFVERCPGIILLSTIRSELVSNFDRVYSEELSNSETTAERFASLEQSLMRFKNVSESYSVSGRISILNWATIIDKQLSWAHFEPTSAADDSKLRKSNRYFQESLRERLLDDVSKEQSGLSLLSYSLQYLYERAESRVKNKESNCLIITESDYQRHANSGSGLGIIACKADELAFSAIREFFDTTYTIVPLVQKLVNLFCRIFLTTAPEFSKLTKRRVSESQFKSSVNNYYHNTPRLCAAFLRMVEEFEHSHLIRVTRTENIVYRQISHDVLVYSWERINAWFYEDLSFHKWLSHHEFLAGLWSAKEGDLITSKDLLDQALYQLEERRSDLPELVIQYIGKSVQRAGEIAEENKIRRAELSVQKDRALLNESILYLEYVKKANDRNRFYDALVLSLHLLPGVYGGKRPFLAEHRSLKPVYRALMSSLDSRVLNTVVQQAICSSDGRYLLLLGSKCRDVQVISVSDFSTLLEVSINTYIDAVSITDEGLVAIGFGNILEIWSVESSQKVSKHRLGFDIYSISTSGNRFIVHGLDQSTLLEHDVQDLDVSIAFSKTKFATILYQENTRCFVEIEGAESKPVVSLIDINSLQKLASFSLTAPVAFSIFTADARYLLIGIKNTLVTIDLELATLSDLGDILTFGHALKDVSRNGNTFLAGDAEGVVLVDVTRKETLKEFVNTQTENDLVIQRAKLDSAGELLVLIYALSSCSAVVKTEVWEVSTGLMCEERYVGGNKVLSISPNGELALVVDVSNRLLELFSIFDKHSIVSKPCHLSGGDFVEFSHDGSHVVIQRKPKVSINTGELEPGGCEIYSLYSLEFLGYFPEALISDLQFFCGGALLVDKRVYSTGLTQLADNSESRKRVAFERGVAKLQVIKSDFFGRGLVVTDCEGEQLYFCPLNQLFSVNKTALRNAVRLIASDELNVKEYLGGSTCGRYVATLCQKKDLVAGFQVVVWSVLGEIKILFSDKCGPLPTVRFIATTGLISIESGFELSVADLLEGSILYRNNDARQLLFLEEHDCLIVSVEKGIEVVKLGNLRNPIVYGFENELKSINKTRDKGRVLLVFEDYYLFWDVDSAQTSSQTTYSSEHIFGYPLISDCADYMLTIDDCSIVRAHCFNTAKELVEFDIECGKLPSSQFLEKERKLLVASDAGCRVFELDSKGDALIRGHNFPVCVSPQERSAVFYKARTENQSSLIMLADLSTGLEVWTYKLPGNTESVVVSKSLVFSPDEKLLLFHDFFRITVLCAVSGVVYTNYSAEELGGRRFTQAGFISNDKFYYAIDDSVYIDPIFPFGDPESLLEYVEDALPVGVDIDSESDFEKLLETYRTFP